MTRPRTDEATAPFTVRLTEKERAKLERAADKAGMTCADWLRKQIEDSARKGR
jgi:hypothetical protein